MAASKLTPDLSTLCSRRGETQLFTFACVFDEQNAPQTNLGDDGLNPDSEMDKNILESLPGSDPKSVSFRL